MDYSNEISELLTDGWSHRDAGEWCDFISGEDNYLEVS